MADTIGGRQRPGEAQGLRRSRQGVRRLNRVEFALTDEELEVFDAAAGRAGLARGAYAAEAAMAVAGGSVTVADTVLRDILTELIQGAGLVRRIGVNLNQAVAKLNATGQRSGDLLPYAEANERRALRLDAAAEHVRKALP